MKQEISSGKSFRCVDALQVALQGAEIGSIPLNEVAGKLKLVNDLTNLTRL